MIVEKLKFKPVTLQCGADESTKPYAANLFTGGCPHALCILFCIRARRYIVTTQLSLP